MQSYGYTSTDEIETEVKTITSFPVMAEVARRFGAIAEVDSNEAIRVDPKLLSVVNNITTMVTPERSEFTNIVTINTMGYDPVEARDLAQIVAETYKDFRRVEVNKRIDNSIEYLKQKLVENEKAMAVAKAALKQFSADNDSLMPYYTNNAISQDMMNLYRNENDLTPREHSIEAMIAQVGKNGILDDSAISGAFAEKEGVIFRDNYSQLLKLYSERDDLKRYYTDEHPEVRTVNNKIESTKKTLLDQLKGTLNLINSQKQGFKMVGKNLRQQLQDVNNKKEELQKMQTDIDLLRNQYIDYMSQLQAVQIKKSENIDEITIITPAVIEPKPVNSPASTTSVTFIGLLLGLILGLVFGFVFEALDTSIGTIEDVEAYLGVPVVGIIPQIEMSYLKDKYGPGRYSSESAASDAASPETNDDQIRLVIKYAPKSTLAESYRALRTNIQFISFEREVKVLMFSSSSPREGKTTTIVNLALTMAQSGNRVLLVDGDMRKPKLNQIFGLDRERGLSEIILGNFKWRDCVKTVTDIITGELGMSDIVLTPGIDNLHIITCGAIPPNPSELLNSDVMDEFIHEVRNDYDMVLFDCTPVLPTTDPAVLGRKVDGVVLVYAVGKVSRGSLKRAKSQLDTVKAHLVGIVLNGMRADNTADYPEYKYNEAYYGLEEQEEIPKNNVEKIKKLMGGFISRFS
ncbi:AAA family ATPase [bacterium]|nr:AAA family ATPase [bacterium]